MAPAIGIDLGTTFSAAAVFRNGKSEIIPNKEGQRLTPSFIFFSPRSLNVSVGTTADDMGVKEIQNFLFGNILRNALRKYIDAMRFGWWQVLAENIFSGTSQASVSFATFKGSADIKRITGRKYDDVYVQELLKSSEYRFHIVRGENDMTEIELLHDNVKVRKTPEQASSEILKYLRESANEYLDAEVTEAVISVPAHFSNAQRKTTRAAAELAGFKVLKLISEPVAAAIYYAEDRLETEGTLLVFDFGGGTLDVSIIEVDKKSFKVKSVEGDTFLGGRNFDQMLLQHFKTDIIRKFGPEIFTDGFLRRVKKACTKQKIKLSTEQEYSLTIPFIGGNEDREYTLGMSRTTFEHLTESLYKRAIHLVKKCIEEAGMSNSDIDKVVLVGGTTRIPKVRNILSAHFSDKKIKTDLNPDEAVALGTAMQAAMIKEKFRDLEKYKVTEVTPLSLGAESMGGLMKIAVKKNSPLPVKSLPLTCYYSKTNQESVRIRVFEGERKMCEYNNFLGSMVLDDLPPGKAGTVICNLIFSLGEDGILEVEAYETSNKQKMKIALTVGEYRLCDNKIKNAIEDAEKNKEKDDIFETFVGFKARVYIICNDILYNIDNIPLTIDRNFVEEKSKQLKIYCETVHYTKIDDLKKKYIAFVKAVNNIICNYIDVKLNDDIEPVQPIVDNRIVSMMSNIKLFEYSNLLPEKK